jgi:hypothetical protein
LNRARDQLRKIKPDLHDVSEDAAWIKNAGDYASAEPEQKQFPSGGAKSLSAKLGSVDYSP